MTDATTWIDPDDLSPTQKAIAEGPHAWMQMKGTDLCADIRCACGQVSHVDGEFVYAVKCPHCGAVYTIGTNVELIPGNPNDFSVTVAQP